MSGVQGIGSRGGKAKNLEKREWGGKVEKESKPQARNRRPTYLPVDQRSGSLRAALA